MELQELTKKNQEFIHTATNKLIQDGKSDEDIKLILEEAIPAILENQKKGVTARNLLGTPTAWAASFSQDPSQRAAETDKNTNPWLMWLDTSLLFIGIVALLNGIMTFFNTNATVTPYWHLVLVEEHPCTLLITLFTVISEKIRAFVQVGSKSSQPYH